MTAIGTKDLGAGKCIQKKKKEVLKKIGSGQEA